MRATTSGPAATRRAWFLGAILASGCTPTSDEPARPVLHPAGGVVTLDGKPLEGAVITFLNLDERGTPSLGEADEAGAYKLKYLGGEGTAAGPYRVAVSYLVGAEGQVLGVARRSTTAPTLELNTAKEQLPARYSDLGRSSLKADVPEGGGRFDFKLVSDPAPPPGPGPGAAPRPETR